MGDLRPFQIGLLGAFALLALIGLFLLSTYTPPPNSDVAQYGQVVIWGTQPREAFVATLRSASDDIETFRGVSYQQIDEADFEATFTNAVAEGNSPDLLALSHKQLVALRSKLIGLDEQTVSTREYKNTYVDGAEIFMLSDGTYALPYGVDPLMLFWNRDLFATNGLAEPPRAWDAVTNTVVPQIVRRTPARDIVTAAVAFGEYRNVQHATDIVSLLMIQAGSALVTEPVGRYQINLNISLSSNTLAPLTTALDFFTRFSNVNTSLYSWNRAQNLDRNEFAAGELAMYFAPGSEVDEIKRVNPNLNFDVAPVPQGSDVTARRTFGTFYGFAIPRASRNPNGALEAARTLSAPVYARELSTKLNIAPVARTLVTAGSDDPFDQVVYNEALAARGWLAPLTSQTEFLFQEMIESVTANSRKVDAAVGEMIGKLERIY